MSTLNEYEQHDQQAILASVPCDILELIKYRSDLKDLGKLITRETYNISMKTCEFISRRKRLAKETTYTTALNEKKETAIKLLPVFQENGEADPSFKFRSLTTEELRHPFIESTYSCGGLKNSVNELVIVKQLSHFKHNFKIFSQQPIIQTVLSKNILVMGGAVLACLMVPKSIKDLYEKIALLIFIAFPPSA